jgi:hypothetical protein
MAVAILLGGIGLLVVGVVIVAATAVHTPREQDLDAEFADARGGALDGDAEPAPWSSVDLAALRSEVTLIDKHDPFATLRVMTSPISWHVSNGYGTEPEPITWRPPVGTA